KLAFDEVSDHGEGAASAGAGEGEGDVHGLAVTVEGDVGDLRGVTAKGGQARRRVRGVVAKLVLERNVKGPDHSPRRGIVASAHAFRTNHGRGALGSARGWFARAREVAKASTMKASDLCVRALEAEGVDTVFALPGEESLDLVESLRASKIRLVVTRHEAAAGFMAATYGRLTGKAGVCLATLGPGATNLLTAAAHAQLGAMPTVVITSQKPLDNSRQGARQLIDVVDMMRPITKYARQIVSADTIPSRIREA